MPDDPIHIYESNEPGALTVREDEAGVPAVLGSSEPYLNGMMLFAPIPVKFTDQTTFLNEIGQLLEPIPVYTGEGPGPEPIERTFISNNEAAGFSAHSLLEGAMSGFVDQWNAQTFLNYQGWSSLKFRWDVNGVDRTGDYAGMLVATEIGDPEQGVADPASAQGQETLQYLLWYAQMAQAKGCSLFLIYPPWTPETGPESFDMDTLQKAVYWKQWLDARPELTTIEVWVIPVPQIIRELRAFYAPQSIFVDGLHLDYTTTHAGIGVGDCIFTVATGDRADHTGDPVEYDEMGGIAYQVALEYDCTGLGGTTHVEPWPVAADPLPNPLPFPDGGDLPLNDPSAFVQAITVSELTPTSGSFVSNANASRRTYNLAVPPAGSLVEFDVETSADLYFRLAETDQMGPSGTLNLVPVMAAGTHHVSVVIPEYTLSTRMGFLAVSLPQTFTVSNWRVTYP